jgi:signal transduction histidine kinase
MAERALERGSIFTHDIHIEKLFKKEIKQNDDLMKQQDELNEMIKADQMLDIVLRNLLSNAVKFSNRGGVVRVAAEVLDQDKILVRVSDQGIGMPTEMIQSLFKVNAKVNRSGTDGEQ